MRIRIQFAGDLTRGLSPMIAVSFGLHIGGLVFFTLIPSFLPARGATPMVYTVDLVDLPPLPEPSGPPAGTPIEPPATEPEPEPEKAEPPPPEKKQQPPPKKEPVPVPRKKPPEKPEDAAQRPPEIKPEPKPSPPADPQPDPVPSPGDTPSDEPVNPPAPRETGASPGPAGGGLPGEGIQGGFDDTSFRFNYYWKSMINIIRSQWSKPIRPAGIQGKIRAVVYFVIRQDGSIWKPELVEWSGYPALDNSALRAVMDSRRLPPLPMQYEKNSVGVRIIFELKEESSP